MSDKDTNPQMQAGHQQFPCNSCGSALLFKPGTSRLKCAHCGAENEIALDDDDLAYLEEHDFLEMMESENLAQEEAADTAQAEAIQCTNCGATTTVTKERTADVCPYCASPLVIQNSFPCKLNVQAVLPFAVNSEQAQGSYRKWLQSRWFAPNDFSRRATREETLKGIYMPFWTYDAKTRTQYRGQRGDAYYVTSMVMVNRGGKMVSEQRQERRVNWTHVSGTVRVGFDDVLVPASRSLPVELQDNLQPWQLKNIKPFRQEFLSGFVTETYQVSLKDGFEDAKQRMEPVIRRAIVRDIGGDEQRIHATESQYSNVTFKHILLPLWMSAYRYNGQTYRFMVNAQTGQVAGTRPWSAWKIAGAIVAGLAVVAGIAYFMQ